MPNPLSYFQFLGFTIQIRTWNSYPLLGPTPQRPLSASCPNELKRLAFYGAGPKMAGFNSKSSQNLQLRMAQQQQHQQGLDENINFKGNLGSSHDPVS